MCLMGTGAVHLSSDCVSEGRAERADVSSQGRFGGWVSEVLQIGERVRVFDVVHLPSAAVVRQDELDSARAGGNAVIGRNREGNGDHAVLGGGYIANGFAMCFAESR